VGVVIRSLASLKFRVLAPGNAMTSLSSSSLVGPRQPPLLQTEIPELLKSGMLDGEVRPLCYEAKKSPLA